MIELSSFADFCFDLLRENFQVLLNGKRLSRDDMVVGGFLALVALKED